MDQAWNDLLDQIGGDGKAQLLSFFGELKDEGHDFVQESALKMTQYSVSLAKKEITQDGYMTRMQDLQAALREKADLQELATKLRWQGFANQVIDLVAKVVISKILGV